MSGIFISYRRDDSGTEARRLWERLAARLGAEQVFMDVLTLEPGDEFAKAIHEKVAFCDALVAVIGPRWLDGVGADGRRRLDDPDDWVRLEIAAALSQGIRVIPVLVRGAALPRASALPPALAALPGQHAVELRPRRFDVDADRLAATLHRLVAGGNVAVSWLALVTRRHRALDPIALERADVLWQALRFLVLMLFVGELLRLPAAAGAGLQYWKVLFLVAYVAVNAVEWLALGTALHLGMRALGGRATLQKSIAVFAFLSAWLPLIGLSQAPVWGLQISVTSAMADVGWSPTAAVEQVTRFVQGLGVFGTIRVVVSFVLATVLWLTLLASVFTAFRTLHGLRGARALAGFVLGLAAAVLVLGLLYAPLIGSVYAAFGIPPR
jgi:hypothetical protein